MQLSKDMVFAVLLGGWDASIHKGATNAIMCALKESTLIVCHFVISSSTIALGSPLLHWSNNLVSYVGKTIVPATPRRVNPRNKWSLEVQNRLYFGPFRNWIWISFEWPSPTFGTVEPFFESLAGWALLLVQTRRDHNLRFVFLVADRTGLGGSRAIAVGSRIRKKVHTEHTSNPICIRRQYWVWFSEWEIALLLHRRCPTMSSRHTHYPRRLRASQWENHFPSQQQDKGWQWR